MADSLRINFVMPPNPKISGGPLAILEYANRFIKLGHTVSITTYPDNYWPGKNPFPWFDFNGKICFTKMRNDFAASSSSVSPESLRLLGRDDFRKLAEAVLGNFGMEGVREIIFQSSEAIGERKGLEFLVQEILIWLQIMEAIPDCDLNIATLWSTAFPVLFSRKGKPVYFMQHYEEIFFPEPGELLQRLLARMSYALPLHKVANSSWLQEVIKERFGQEIPFSNNALNLADFSPRTKLSESDGVIRVFSYSRPEAWKGFGDAVAAMARIRERYGERVEWHVFGYRHLDLPEDNPYARYRYHPRLSFKELGELYATSDIALCPSWYESFPLPPLEAMASGTAVITTRCGTEDYAFHDQNALVVGGRDVEGMYRALCRLVENGELRARLEKSGLETAKKFTWDRAVERRERILLDIHRGKPGYDVTKSANIGFTDSTGIPYELPPADISCPGAALFIDDGRVFLVHNGVRRQVASPDLIPILTGYNIGYIELDALTRVRMPTGSPVAVPSDLPGDLCNQKSQSSAAALLGSR